MLDRLGVMMLKEMGKSKVPLDEGDVWIAGAEAQGLLEQGNRLLRLPEPVLRGAEIVVGKAEVGVARDRDLEFMRRFRKSALRAEYEAFRVVSRRRVGIEGQSPV